MVEEGAKASQTIMWLSCLCIKPETSEMQKKKAFPCHCKSEKFLPRFPHFPRELWKGCYMQPESLWAVLKIDILGPGDRMTCKATQTR